MDQDADRLHLFNNPDGEYEVTSSFHETEIIASVNRGDLDVFPTKLIGPISTWYHYQILQSVVRIS